MAGETHYQLAVRGLRCGGCASKVHDALRGVRGVHAVHVSHEKGAAAVEGDGLDPSRLVDAVAGAGDFIVEQIDAVSSPPVADAIEAPPRESLYPLILIGAFIAGTTLLIASATGQWAPESMMRHFMAGFFLVFSFFKLLDLRGFVSAYRGYDLVACALPVWAWAYPFVELALGACYVLDVAPMVVNATTFLLMVVGAGGVLLALRQKRVIRCACLGTALNLPMTKVTLVEDLTMAAMAGVMIVLALF